MRRLWSLATGLLVLGMIVGCQNQKGQQTIATPSLAHPRSADVQQKRALRYDPYPETNVGPEMVGVRPREYRETPRRDGSPRWGKRELRRLPQLCTLGHNRQRFPVSPVTTPVPAWAVAL